MKKLCLITIIACLFAACEEVPPAIDFSEPIVLLKDSVYISTSIALPQHKAVLLEDITGVRCVNCPNAAIKAKDIVAQKSKDSVIVIALYPNISALDNFTRPFSGVPQPANDISKQVVEFLGIPSGLPNGYVDRKLFSGKTDKVVGVNEWASLVNERLKLNTPVNITLTKTIIGRKIMPEIRLQYTANVNSTNHKYALYLIEDSIVSSQLTQSGTKTDYVHNHVLKYAFGVATGVGLNASLVPGRTFVKQFEYEVPLDIRIKKCHLICVVMDASNDEVINVREIDL